MISCEFSCTDSTTKGWSSSVVIQALTDYDFATSMIHYWIVHSVLSQKQDLQAIEYVPVVVHLPFKQYQFLAVSPRNIVRFTVE